jgi:RimJ/RimL family protein N-acetyltransferase
MALELVLGARGGITEWVRYPPTFGAGVQVRHAHRPDRAEWVQMRTALRPDEGEAGHADDVDAFSTTGTFRSPDAFLPWKVLLAERPEGGLCGFVEASIGRTWTAFDAHWAKVLRDPTLTAKAILLGEVLVGTVSCFWRDGQANVGYWVGREHWGKGIASRALELLLLEVPARPLYAHVATSNGASLRVLRKCGFVVERVRVSPATDRHPECEEAVLVLTGVSARCGSDDEEGKG